MVTASWHRVRTVAIASILSLLLMGGGAFLFYRFAYSFLLTRLMEYKVHELAAVSAQINGDTYKEIFSYRNPKQHPQFFALLYLLKNSASTLQSVESMYSVHLHEHTAEPVYGVRVPLNEYPTIRVTNSLFSLDVYSLDSTTVEVCINSTTILHATPETEAAYSYQGRLYTLKPVAHHAHALALSVDGHLLLTLYTFPFFAIAPDEALITTDQTYQEFTFALGSETIPVAATYLAKGGNGADKDAAAVPAG